MLKLSDLACRPDFQLGPLLISPSLRLVEGPHGRTHLEPLIMQVFLLLVDARGRVVTRTELFDQCWGGTIVGDDSLNRAIANVRRITGQVGPGLFEVETIPRTGYRLTGEIISAGGNSAVTDDFAATASSGMARRRMIGTGILAAALGASGLLFMERQGDPKARDLIEKAREAMRSSSPTGDTQALTYMREATRLDPNNAEAWGLLALLLRDSAEEAPVATVSKTVLETEVAAKRALAIDSKEPNARTALVTIRPEFGRWGDTEDGLRAILKDAPVSIPAMTYLVIVLQSVGRARESFSLNERLIALDPFSPVHQYRRGIKLWILGRIAEADLAIDRALQLWPRQPAVWNARLMIFAFTQRANAGLAMLNDVTNRPSLPEPFFDNWRVSLKALATRTPTDIAAARIANMEAAPKSPSAAVLSVMALSALGEIDTAFAVAEGSLLRKGPLIGTIAAGNGVQGVNDQYWRRTMNLFTPATAAMRTDPRFRGLCEGMGMMAYWRTRKIWPDAMFRLNFS